MDFIKEKKFLLVYLCLAVAAIACILVGLFTPTMVDQVGPYNVFSMLSAYKVKGEHQGFISLMTPIVVFFTIICYLPSLVLWVIGAIKNSKAKFLVGLPIVALILQIVWGALFANYLNISGWDVFFDMSRSDKVGGGYWAMMIINIVIIVACFVLKFTVCKKDKVIE